MLFEIKSNYKLNLIKTFNTANEAITEYYRKKINVHSYIWIFLSDKKAKDTIKLTRKTTKNIKKVTFIV